MLSRLFDEPWFVFVVVVGALVGLCAVGIMADSAYRRAHVAEWMTECSARCEAQHAAWSWTDRNGCTCGTIP